MSRQEGEVDPFQLKYKKALQEITHILRVNDSLKKCLDQAHTEREQQVGQIGLQLVQTQQQSQASHNTIQKLQAALSQEQNRNHQLHLKLQNLNQTKGSEASTSQAELTKVRSENELLRSRMAGHAESRRERERLNEEIARLKVREEELVGALARQRQKSRKEMCTRQTEWMRSREGESERLRSIESKYQLLQSELSNYKQMEKYWEDEAKSMEKEEVMFNNIRQQIERINQDFNRHEMESCNVLLRKRQEDADKDRQMSSLQGELAEKQEVILQLEQRIKIKDKELGEVGRLKSQIEDKEDTNKRLNERVYVLEALTEAQQHRSGNALSERIREFEARVKLLVQEEPNPQAAKAYGGLQQVIVLKGYVLQLSEKINQGKKREERLERKLRRIKSQLGQQQKVNDQKILEYKKRMQGYDTLVNRLYGIAEEKAREKMPEDMQQEFNTAIAHYQGKMISMTEEIIALRKEKETLQMTSSIEKSPSQATEEQRSAITQKDDLIEQLGSELTQRDLIIEQLRQNQGDNSEANEIRRQLAQQNEQMTAYKQELAALYDQLRRDKSVKSSEIIEATIQMKTEIESLRYQNRALTEQLNSKQQQMMQYYNDLQRRMSGDTDAIRLSELEHTLKVINEERQEERDKITVQINELNGTIVQLRTKNFELRRELEDRDVTIDQLKHQLFMEELRSQRQKSASSSVVRDSFRQKAGDGQSSDPRVSSGTVIQTSEFPQRQTYHINDMQATSERTLGQQDLLNKKGAVLIKKIL